MLVNNLLLVGTLLIGVVSVVRIAIICTQVKKHGLRDDAVSVMVCSSSSLSPTPKSLKTKNLNIKIVKHNLKLEETY